jgi:hypothetical protein
MKTIASMIVIGSIFSFNLSGQIHKNPDLPGYQKKDSMCITFPADDPEYGHLKKKFNLPDNILINPDLDIKQKRFNIESPARRSYSDKLRAEKFPGADIFYAKRPYLNRPSDRSFIIKPDTTAKYYLIIKDPFTGRITN